MRLLFALCMAASVSFAAIQGTVTNRTTGKPQAGAVLTLVELGAGGMNNVGSTKADPEGNFKFDKEASASAPYLVQAQYQGVTYNKMLPPGTAGQPVAVDVFNAATRVPEAKVSQDMILIERSGDQIVVNETVIYSNEGTTTYQDPSGTLKIQVPPEVSGPLRMRLTAPGGMPISRDPEKGSSPNTWVVKYPIKPGETRIDFSYSMPAGKDVVKFKSRVLHGGGPVRFVAPQGLKLAGSALNDLGPEPRTQATVYELKGTDINVDVSGSGQLRAANEEQQKPAGEENSDTPNLDVTKPRIFGRIWWIVGLTLAMLGLGFVALYNKGSQA